MDKDSLVRLSIAERVVDKATIDELYAQEPFACHLIMQKFNEFLTDPSFDKLERQLILLKFLSNNPPLELARSVIEAVNKSEFASDYVKIIMEWNYTASEYIKQEAMKPFDAVQLAFDKQTKSTFDMILKQKNTALDIAADITKSLLDNSNEE